MFKRAPVESDVDTLLGIPSASLKAIVSEPIGILCGHSQSVEKRDQAFRDLGCSRNQRDVNQKDEWNGVRPNPPGIDVVNDENGAPRRDGSEVQAGCSLLGRSLPDVTYRRYDEIQQRDKPPEWGEQEYAQPRADRVPRASDTLCKDGTKDL